MVRCWTRSCGSRGSPRQGGRDPPGSSSYSWKSSSPLAALGFGHRGALCAASALVGFCPRGLRSGRATHLVVSHGEWPPPVPLRRSAARDATEHAAAAPSSASRSSECREQPRAAARWSPSLEISPNTRAGASLGQTSVVVVCRCVLLLCVVVVVVVCGCGGCSGGCGADDGTRRPCLSIAADACT